MTRYQAYLNPQSVAIMDDVARLLHVSRSQIIRDVVRLPKNLSQNVDEIYLRD